MELQSEKKVSPQRLFLPAIHCTIKLKFGAINVLIRILNAIGQIMDRIIVAVLTVQIFLRVYTLHGINTPGGKQIIPTLFIYKLYGRYHIKYI